MTKSVSTKLPPKETRDGYILGHLSKGMGFRFGYDYEFVNPYPEGPAGDAFTGRSVRCVRGMTGTKRWAGKSPAGGARTGGNHFGIIAQAVAGAVRGCKAPCRCLSLTVLGCRVISLMPERRTMYRCTSDLKRGSGRQLVR